jgi:hypothetical protein
VTNLQDFDDAISDFRYCKRCDENKPLSEFQQHVRKEGKKVRYRCKKCQKEAYNRLDYKQGKSTYNRLRKYGIDGQQFSSLVERQKGLCKICKGSLGEGRYTHVDHCHNTGKVRGILCHTCNTKLGWAEKHLDEIMIYLRQDELLN